MMVVGVEREKKSKRGGGEVFLGSFGADLGGQGVLRPKRRTSQQAKMFYNVW